MARTLDNTSSVTNQSQHIDSHSRWFFYWKISAQLWDLRMKEYASEGARRLIVPIYWAFHQEKEGIDFGQGNPQTDLHHLSECALRQGLDLVYLFPLGPNPMWANGGLPANLAKTTSVHRYGLNLKIPFKNTYAQLYSFYEPSVFSALKKFAWYLKHYFAQMNITHPILGISAGYLEEGEFISFRQDYSSAFDYSFGKFLTSIEKQTSITESEKETYIQKFEENVEELYIHMLHKVLGDYYVGSIQVCFMHSHPLQILLGNEFPKKERSLGEIYTASVCLQKGFIPYWGVDWDLLQSDFTASPWVKFLAPLENIPYTYSYFSHRIEEGRGEEIYLCLCVFGNIKVWQELGIFDLKNKGLNHSIYHEEEIEKIHFSEDVQQDRLYLVDARDLKENTLKKVLHGFLLGHNILLHMEGIDLCVENRIQMFVVENGLKFVRFKLFHPMGLIELGEGKLLCLYPNAPGGGNSNTTLSLGKKNHFWEKIFTLGDIKFPLVQLEEGLFYYWKTKQGGAQHPRYSQIRSLHIFNIDQRMKFIRVYKKEEFPILAYTPYSPTGNQFSSFSHFDEIGIKGSTGLKIEFGVL